MFKEAGVPDFSRVSLEALGSEDSYGPNSRTLDAREVLLSLLLLLSPPSHRLLLGDSALGGDPSEQEGA